MKKILLVDDDPEVIGLLTAKLERTERYTVRSAAGGAEALRLAASERPDLLLCDIDMPDMDGVSLADALGRREETRAIPILFLSSLVTPGDVRRGVTAGKWPMLSKRGSLQDIVARIDATLDRP